MRNYISILIGALLYICAANAHSIIFMRGDLIAPEGQPATNEIMTINITHNQSGFSLEQNNTRLKFPENGFYSVTVWNFPDMGNALPLDNMSSADIPSVRCIVRVGGIISLYNAPINYVTNTGGILTNFYLAGSSQVGVVEITNYEDQYLRTEYLNNATHTLPITQPYFIIIQKLN